MKNLVLYYLAITIPLLGLLWISKYGNAMWFTILLLIYAIPYRTLIDGRRLVNKKLIKWNEIWKLLIPGLRFDNFKELYFKK